MLPRSLHFTVAATLLLSYQLLLSVPPTDGASTSVRGRLSERDDQWGDNFPYLLMMMSGSNVILPSVWLIPVVITSCIMLIIRSTID